MASREIGNQLDVFPAFHQVAGRRVVVVGGGDAAAARLRLVGQTTAHPVLVSKQINAQTMAAIDQVGADWISHRLTQEVLAGAVLIFAASDDPLENKAAADAARAVGIAVNVMDVPEQCDFFVPAIVNRAPVAIAISSGGAGPVLTQMLRGRIEALLSPHLGGLARLAGSLRAQVTNQITSMAARRLYWRAFFSGSVARAVESGHVLLARREAGQLLLNAPEDQARVSFVNIGPGEADLVTLRAHRVLQEADVIIHDSQIAPEIFALARRDARRIAINSGRSIAALKNEARDGRHVVRLVIGDPRDDATAADEIAALRHHGIQIDIIPGLTIEPNNAAAQPAAA